MKMINVNNLVKYYGQVETVKGISFSVEEGAFFAFLGINGETVIISRQYVPDLKKRLGM